MSVDNILNLSIRTTSLQCQILMRLSSPCATISQTYPTS